MLYKYYKYCREIHIRVPHNLSQCGLEPVYCIIDINLHNHNQNVNMVSDADYSSCADGRTISA